MFVNKEYKFLGEIPNFDLPSGYMINKGKVGCGGTSIAMENNKNTIVCVPFVSLIKNKQAKYGEKMLGVYQGITADEIRAYIAKEGTKKIMCTYESLERVVKITGYEMFLLVDELHLLFQQYILRNEAVRFILENYTRFKEWAFLTATPIEPELMLDELKDVPTFDIEWESKQEAKVKAIYCNNVLVSIKNIIKDYLDGRVFGNAHIFINSVDSIAKLIKNCELNNENTRIIFSKSNGKYRNTCQGVKNQETTDPVKKINMYTSTCFEGSDIWDEQGKIYIVSDSSKAQTLYDISTQIVQIAGRIRNTHYTEITHLYNNTRYAGDITLEQYKEIVEKERKEGVDYADIVNQYENVADMTQTVNNQYLYKVDKVWKLDPNRLKLDIYNFKCLHNTYCISYNIIDEYEKAGFEVATSESMTSDKLLANDTARTTFKDAITEYDTIRTRIKECKYYIEDTDRLDLIRAKYPYIEQAYELLGMDKIKEMKYKTSNIREAIICRTNSLSNVAKIAKLLKEAKGFQLGAFITGKNIKRVLGEIYEMLGMNRKPTIDDFRQFATLQERKTRVDGEQVRGYVIQHIKIV